MLGRFVCLRLGQAVVALLVNDHMLKLHTTDRRAEFRARWVGHLAAGDA